MRRSEPRCIPSSSALKSHGGHGYCMRTLQGEAENATLSMGQAGPGPDHILPTLTLALEGWANLSQPWPGVGKGAHFRGWWWVVVEENNHQHRK